MALSPRMKKMESSDMDKLTSEIFTKLESNWLSNTHNNIAKVEIPELIQEILGYKEMSVNKKSRRRTYVLSIDGGGARAIIAAKALAFLEEHLKSKSGNEDATIADYFDVVTGTGTGGVLAAMLFAKNKENNGRPLYSAKQACELFTRNVHKFYLTRSKISKFLSNSVPRYSSCSLEKLLRSWFPESMTLRDIVADKAFLVPCYDIKSAAPFVFSRADAMESQSYDFKLWEVCRATTAMPGVFSAKNLESVDGKTRCRALDGGVSMSNPAVCGVTHVLHNKRQFPDVTGIQHICVVSLGTGQFDRLVDGVSSVFDDVTVDALSNSVDHSLSIAFAHCPQNYIRIQAMSMPSRSVPGKTDGGKGNVKEMEKVWEDMKAQKVMETVAFGGKRMLKQTNGERLEWVAEMVVAEDFLKGKMSFQDCTNSSTFSMSSPSSSSCLSL